MKFEIRVFKWKMLVELAKQGFLGSDKLNKLKFCDN